MTYKRMKHKTTKRKSTSKFRRGKHLAADKIALKALRFGRKHATKENVDKAIRATKAAESKLKGLLSKLKRKKKEPERITMSLFR